MIAVPEKVEDLATPEEAPKSEDGRAGEASRARRARDHENIRRHVGGADVPASVLKSAVLEVASDLYARRQHHNGVVTFDGPEGVTPFRVNRDPMASAYPILRPYIAPPVA